MTITPKTLSQLPFVETYEAEDVLLIIRNGQFYRLNELPQGIQGEPGLPGENGLPATFRRDGAWLQWKLSGEVDWINLVPLADIKGDSGETIELQVTATHIQYRVVGSVDWIDLVPLADIKGEQGEQGLQGIQGLQGESVSGGGWPYPALPYSVNGVNEPKLEGIFYCDSGQFFFEQVGGPGECEIDILITGYGNFTFYFYNDSNNHNFSVYHNGADNFGTVSAADADATFSFLGSGLWQMIIRRNDWGDQLTLITDLTLDNVTINPNP